MSWRSPSDPCLLQCKWQHTDMCLRCLLSDEAIAEHHLSLGVAFGLRHVYYPNDLPPCVHHNGDLDWTHPVEEPQVALEAVH